ncbi:hypothetical protein [Enterobacter roggenkampii]|uniref:hypothetical protein n=1 Tax=Enterobacter roggenkampii TaxID=1812935 RepID=UPI001FD74DF1|nr:hypothetical protein [Enterobacter roggenkampii]
MEISCAEQMRNHDREQMITHGHNRQNGDTGERAPVGQVAKVFNELFNQLRRVRPA